MTLPSHLYFYGPFRLTIIVLTIPITVFVEAAGSQLQTENVVRKPTSYVFSKLAALVLGNQWCLNVFFVTRRYFISVMVYRLTNSKSLSYVPS